MRNTVRIITILSLMALLLLINGIRQNIACGTPIDKVSWLCFFDCEQVGDSGCRWISSGCRRKIE